MLINVRGYSNLDGGSETQREKIICGEGVSVLRFD